MTMPTDDNGLAGLPGVLVKRTRCHEDRAGRIDHIVIIKRMQGTRQKVSCDQKYDNKRTSNARAARLENCASISQNKHFISFKATITRQSIGRRSGTL